MGTGNVLFAGRAPQIGGQVSLRASGRKGVNITASPKIIARQGILAFTVAPIRRAAGSGLVSAVVETTDAVLRLLAFCLHAARLGLEFDTRSFCRTQFHHHHHTYTSTNEHGSGRLINRQPTLTRPSAMLSQPHNIF